MSNSVIINNQFYDLGDQTSQSPTIFQFCLENGINLPCFCYHEKLSIAGNCRICLVEVNSSGKLELSCSLTIRSDMIIKTKSKRVSKARESILEFLLINHPLDCPICDQGGECDLQDLSLTFGSERSRFYNYKKRSVENIYFSSPFIKTVMDRCIHCTRCVRFINEVSGNFEFGVIGRGTTMEIGTYINKSIDDFLVGNVIDLCPVGALCTMPSAYRDRS